VKFGIIGTNRLQDLYEKKQKRRLKIGRQEMCLDFEGEMVIGNLPKSKIMDQWIF
jgi:hypothetical protein